MGKKQIILTVALVALVASVFVVARSCPRRRIARAADRWEFPYRCQICGATYVTDNKTLNMLHRQGRTEEPEHGYLRLYECEECGEIEATLYEPPREH